MAQRDPSTRIKYLLDSLTEKFPTQKATIEKIMRDQYGLNEPVDLIVGPPERVKNLPTFKRSISRPLTPMLQARFDYAGRWASAGEIWLAASEMQRWMRRRDIRRYHEGLRENFDGSAPSRWKDEELTLFGATEGVPDHLTYLVWSHGNGEPEVWNYAGLESYEFKNLEDYLLWHLNA